MRPNVFSVKDNKNRIIGIVWGSNEQGEWYGEHKNLSEFGIFFIE